MGMSSPVSPKRCCCVSAEAAVGASECAGGQTGFETQPRPSENLETSLHFDSSLSLSLCLLASWVLLA